MKKDLDRWNERSDGTGCAAAKSEQALLRRAGAHIAEPGHAQATLGEQIGERGHADEVPEAEAAQQPRQRGRTQPAGRTKTGRLEAGSRQNALPSLEAAGHQLHIKAEKLGGIAGEEPRPQTLAPRAAIRAGHTMGIAVQHDLGALRRLLAQESHERRAASEIVHVVFVWDDLQHPRPRPDLIKGRQQPANLLK